MPSEQRLHPVTLLFDLAKHVKNFAVPGILVIFGASSTGGPGGNFGRIPSGWEVWLFVLLIPAAVASIINYLTFSLRYDDRELVIRTGLIFRNVRHVPFSRIQNVDAIQNVFHRLFGVVEVRVETGGGKEEEARLSVLPRAAFDDMRRHVFKDRDRRGGSLDPPAERAEPAQEIGETLLHLPIRELLLCGFLENKGMVLIGAAYGVLWETGIANRIWGMLFGPNNIGRGFFRNLIRGIFDEAVPLPIGSLGIVFVGFLFFLLLVRVISMIWGLVRLYDFRLARVREDLRTEYGLFTKVTATVPIRRVQTITVRAGPLHRWLDRATVRVETAGGTGTQASAHSREWLAPLIKRENLSVLLQHVLPGFDIAGVRWQPLHPRAFRRAIKPGLVVTAVLSLGSALVFGWGAIGVFVVLLLWTIVATQKMVEHLGWAEDDEVVLMRSGWLWQQITIARVNKIQAVTMNESPFDRRAAMASVRVDTACASPLARVDIPYLDGQAARELAGRLSANAANTAFRW
jgi:putative membrane protein